jgi:serine/threonine-protein kinase
MVFLEDYTLLDELGQGGYATVYKVRHNNLGYIRAIRVLNAIIAHGESDKTYQKFLEECKLLLRLGNGNHPNIVHIYQPLLKAQRAIVEMDFVDGKDLYHYLEEKHSFVEIKDVLRLLSDIGSALSYCHEDIYKFCMDKDEDNLQDDPEDGRKVLLDNKTKQRLINKYRVIHNDIHSGNIIRREDGSYVLLDFGLAIEGDSVVRSSRRKNGAPEFKAPEKWENDSILTTQSDIYSFGVVLYEYLAGRVPFLFDKKNSNPVEAEYLLGKAHKEQQPASIFDLRKAAFEHSHPGETYEKDYPEWLEMLIMKCLSKSTKDRFKNGKELYSFVLEYTNNEADTQIEDLRREIVSLQNKITSLEKATPIPSKEVDKLVTDLQEQLKDVLLSKSSLEQKVKKIQSENTSLKKQQKLYDEVNVECNELRDKIETLECRLKETEEELENATNKLSNLARENKALQGDNAKLRNNTSRSSGKVWRILSVLLFISTCIIAILYMNKPTYVGSSDVIAVEVDDGAYEGFSSSKIKSLISERDSLINILNSKSQINTPIKNDDRIINQLKGDIQKKEEQIATLNIRIDELNQEVSTLKSNQNTGGYTQSDIDAKDKTIRSLNSEISRLRNQIKEKDRLINALNEQIGVN